MSSEGKEVGMPTKRYADYGFTPIRPVPVSKDGTTALIVIDMQYHDASADQGFNLAMERIDPGSMDYFNKRTEEVTVPAIRRLLDYFRANAMPVIHIVVGTHDREYGDLPPRLAGWVRYLEEKSGVQDLLWSGNPAFAIRAELDPLPDELVLMKRTSGAFNSTDLDNILKHRGLTSLIITGVSTNMCVETTARDAADRGYACILVDDGMADYDQAAHDATLRMFHFNFGRVVRRPEDLISALEERDEAI
jgi:biuret amidohydrolase